jgi:HK97 gp10 family phage protein
MATLTRRDKALAKMAALPKHIRDALRDRLRRETQKLAALMKRRVRVDTGRLNLSVTVYPGGAPGTQAAKADPELTFDIVAGAGPGSMSEHARPVEFGTEDTDPQPFFYPSYRQSKPAIRSALRAAVRKAIKKAASS